MRLHVQVDVIFTDTCRLKIHLHRWIIIKACYYIRNMKLKRPSGANDYEALADMEGEGAVSTDDTNPKSPDLERV